MQLAVVSPFLDKRHGTELCIIEQLERFARQYNWGIHIYSQRVEDVPGVQAWSGSLAPSPGAIFWHRVSAVPGPHLLQYLWWFFANGSLRRKQRNSNTFPPELIYCPGINCFDADVIVVHIVFHEFYSRVRDELSFLRVPIQSWPLILHRRLYYRLLMALEKRIYRNPRVKLIAVSQLVANQLQAFFERSDVAIIPNAVDTHRFTPEIRENRREAARASFELKPDDVVCLLIGNDWKKKGLDTLLHAAQQLAKPSLIIFVVGKDDPVVYQPLVRRLGLQDRLKFLPPSADVMAYYAAADIYIGPSLEDAFNLPIVEAMACGLPVIASIRAGASDLVRDGETGLLLRDPQSPEELAGHIRRLYESAHLRGTLGSAARAYVAENCSWDTNALRTREFLEGVLESQEAADPAVELHTVSK